MGKLRVRNGRCQIATSEIGGTIEKTVSVFRSTRTEISTKECGAIVRDMDKVHIGRTKGRTNLEENIREIGLRECAMEEALSSLKMETDMTVIGWEADLTEKAE